MKDFLSQMVFLNLLFFSALSSFAQTNSSGLVSAKIVQSQLSLKEEIHVKPRKWMKQKSPLNRVSINPVYYIGSGLMYFYQNVLSAQISADCSYKISCSEYTKKSIERFGLFKGTLKGFHQFTNCTNNIYSEFPDYKVNTDFIILNSIEEEE